jgi:hypothetical protein
MRQISEGLFAGIAALDGDGEEFTCLICFMGSRLRGRLTSTQGSNLYEHMRAFHKLNMATVPGFYQATRALFDELAQAIQSADAGRAERAWRRLCEHDVRIFPLDWPTEQCLSTFFFVFLASDAQRPDRFRKGH